MSKVAFITGGNGITGTAILEYLVKNSTAKEWSRFIVTSRSPLKTTIKDDRVSFLALDFQDSPSILEENMRTECKDVTHAYFSSYIHKDDFNELNKANEALFSNFLDALVAVAPKLENCTLQTGGKHYGLHLMPVPAPTREDTPRVEGPIPNFYYPQEDALFAKQKGQKWTWNVIRPEAIIGHTYSPNGMNSALTFALYFLVCKELGIEASMPTNQVYFNGYDCVSDSRLLADLTIYVSTKSHCANEAFNINNGDVLCWRYMWPRLAEYFGAKASSDQVFSKPRPEEGTLQLEISLAEWAKDKGEIWERICEKEGVPEAKATWDAGTWGFQDWVFQRAWCGTLSISKAREFGWTGYMDSYKSFTDTFKKFVELRQIPGKSLG
jgi:nucleoside-diphosphate-sugar epimerase